MTTIDSSAKGPTRDADSRVAQHLRKLSTAKPGGGWDQEHFDCRCENMLDKLAAHGVQDISLLIVFDDRGVAEPENAKFKRFKCGPYVLFKDLTEGILTRLERTLVSIAADALEASLGLHGLEVRNLSAVIRVCTRRGEISIERVSRCSPLPELADEGYGIRLYRCRYGWIA
jgi:hypothetical protein